MLFQETIKKLNYKLIEYQKNKQWPVVFGYPYWLTIDPSNKCNLRCVFCPTGQRRGSRESAVMPFDRFKAIIDTLGPFLMHVDFCNWGEPLINREIADMITYLKGRFDVEARVDSNMNVSLSPERAEALIRSGLDWLTVSLDGASQETYEKYRRDGNFSLAYNNIKLLAKKKKELGAQSPHIHWQFLVFRHNEHEMEAARALSKEAGADSIGFTAPFCDPAWASQNEEFNRYIVKESTVAFKPAAAPCNWLWDAATINANGSVSPCCSVEDEKDDFGNFFTPLEETLGAYLKAGSSLPHGFPGGSIIKYLVALAGLRTPFFFVWNNREFRRARRFVTTRTKDGGADNACTRCDHIGVSNHAVIKTDGQ